MTEGIVDNYLTDEEKAYFESGGRDEKTEEKLEENYEKDTSEEDESSYTEETSEDTESIKDPHDEKTEDLIDDSEDEEESEGEKAKRDYEKAFKTERYKRKEMKEALEAQAKKAAELEQNLAKLQQAIAQGQQPTQQTPQPQEVIPDPQEDPLGYIQYEQNKIKQYVAEQNQYLRQQYEAAQKANKEQAFLQTYKQQADSYAKETPDFYDAYNHLVKEKLAEYVEAGYTPDQANRLLVEDEMAIVAKALQDNVNPAERIYKTAKRRGYNGPPKQNTKPVKDLAAIKKGLENSKSLRSGGGEMPDRELGIDNIDDMNDQEFEEFFNKFKAKSKGR